MIISFFKQFCTAKGFSYHYGNQAVLNLIDSENEFTGDKVYFLHDLNRESMVPNRYGRLERVTHTGGFMLVVPSDMDDTFKNKYSNNIEPLRTHLVELLRDIGCSSFIVDRFDLLPIYDAKDINFDGWAVNYQITEIR
jgi:hypothetical protein